MAQHGSAKRFCEINAQLGRNQVIQHMAKILLTLSFKEKPTKEAFLSYIWDEMERLISDLPDWIDCGKAVRAEKLPNAVNEPVNVANKTGKGSVKRFCEINAQLGRNQVIQHMAKILLTFSFKEKPTKEDFLSHIWNEMERLISDLPDWIDCGKAVKSEKLPKVVNEPVNVANKTGNEEKRILDLNLEHWVGDEENDLDLRYFQISNTKIFSFKELGLMNWGHLKSALKERCLSNFQCEEVTNLIQYIKEDDSFDFDGFYKNLPRLNHFYMRFPAFDNAVEGKEDIPLKRSAFEKSIIWLQGNNIRTYGELCLRMNKGLNITTGLGPLKYQSILKGINDFIEKAGDVYLKPEETTPLISKIRVEGYSNGNLHPQKLCTDLANTPLVKLHMGNKVHVLENNDIKTLGDLWKRFTEGFQQIKSFGKLNLAHVVKVSTQILHSLNEEGDIVWDLFCKKSGIPYIPEKQSIASGEEFLSLLPVVLNQVIEASADEVEKEILTQRLTKNHKEQKTLEEIGVRFQITRERIRQIEKNLLSELSNGFLYAEYKNLEYRFRPGFCKYFQIASNAFMEKRETPFEEFLKTLSKIWDVDINFILPHVTFITAVLSNKPLAPAELRVDGILSPLLMGEIPKEVRVLKLNKFPIGKYVDEFSKHGIDTIDDALERAKLGALPFVVSSSARKLLNEIFQRINNMLQKGLCHSVDILEQYAQSNDLPIVPDEEIGDVRFFINNIKPTIKKLLSEKCFYKHSLEIFIERSSLKKADRKTLEMVGQMLGADPAPIKNRETRMLGQLHQQLIERDFREINIVIRHSFLEFWSQANDIYEQNKNFPSFSRELAKRWNVSLCELENDLDLLWTVLNLYPNGRKVWKHRKGKKLHEYSSPPNQEISPMKTMGVIKLRGFKRVY